MKFGRYFLIYSIIPLLLLSIGASYTRTFIQSDFNVGYEAECNPERESCFLGCEDEECTSTYPYKYIVKHATDIKSACSDTVAECAEAQKCSETDSYCEIEYCTPENEDCFVVNDIKGDI